MRNWKRRGNGEATPEDIYAGIERLEKLSKKIRKSYGPLLLKGKVIYGLLPESNEKKACGEALAEYKKERDKNMEIIRGRIENFMSEYYVNKLGYTPYRPISETIREMNDLETRYLKK